MVSFRKRTADPSGTTAESQPGAVAPSTGISAEDADAVAAVHETMEIGVRQLQQEIRSRVAAEGQVDRLQHERDRLQAELASALSETAHLKRVTQEALVASEQSSRNTVDAAATIDAARQFAAAMQVRLFLFE